MQFARASGILLHPTSLPGRFGIGDIGDEAYCFVEFLLAAGQSLWQVLPLGPTDQSGSPYSSYSAFAGNTLLISPEELVQDELLQKSDLDGVPVCSDEKVDFHQVRTIKERLLTKAFDRFQQTRPAELRTEFESFVQDNVSWLDDYSLFRALKQAHDEKPWVEWPEPLARREPSELERARDELQTEIEAQKFFQFLFFRQWSSLKQFCNQCGVKIVGDLPMFVAHDSADVWANRQLFKLNSAGHPTVVAGVPPDYFSETGQLWGNPIYDWQRLREVGFKWWIERLRASFRLFDRVRLDHFRGFAACWEIPARETTAECGKWVETPGRELFGCVRNALGELPIIAEDLGLITSAVEALRKEFGFPAMRVLQFAFSNDETNINLPENYERDVVAYTGTHDNDTTVGWFRKLSETKTPAAVKEKEFCLKYLESDGEEIGWDFIRAVISSVADTAIVPLQDVLGLGSEARMNTPSTINGNWSWRFTRDSLTAEHALRLKRLTEEHNRSAALPFSVDQ